MAEKTFKNICQAPVLGHQPGEVFKADISDAQQKRMEARGSIEEVDASQLSIEDSTPEGSSDSNGGDDKGGTPATTPPKAGAGGRVPPAVKKG